MSAKSMFDYIEAAVGLVDTNLVLLDDPFGDDQYAREQEVLDFKSPKGNIGKIIIPSYSEVKKIQALVEENLGKSDEIIEEAIVS